MRLQGVGIWWLPSSLLRDDWLISRRTNMLFLLSAMLVIALTPVFRGLDTTKMTFWQRLPWGMWGILGPIGLFFLWFGMWQYWVRIDRSSAWSKRTWFFVLLIGFWWGSVLYYFFAYLPHMMRKTRTVT
jgi:hypothetical protein